MENVEKVYFGLKHFIQILFIGLLYAIRKFGNLKKFEEYFENTFLHEAKGYLQFINWFM